MVLDKVKTITRITVTLDREEEKVVHALCQAYIENGHEVEISDAIAHRVGNRIHSGKFSYSIEAAPDTAKDLLKELKHYIYE